MVPTASSAPASAHSGPPCRAAQRPSRARAALAVGGTLAESAAAPASGPDPGVAAPAKAAGAASGPAPAAGVRRGERLYSGLRFMGVMPWGPRCALRRATDVPAR